MGRTRRVIIGAVTGVLAVALYPAVASAHALSRSRFDAPLPFSLLALGAGATVALTAVWLALVDRDSATVRPRTVFTVSRRSARAGRLALAAVGLVTVVAVLATGLLGRQVPASNFATVFTWAVWIHGLALLAIAVGSPWAAASPWATLYRGICRLEGEPLVAFPDRGRTLAGWVALVGFVAVVGVVENLTVIPRSPRLTAAVVAVYGVVVVGGAVLFGPKWLREADPLGVFYRLLGRAAPVAVDSREDATALVVRSPWHGSTREVAGLTSVGFVVAAVYTVSFDGFSETRRYQELLFEVRSVLGTGPQTSVLLYVLGLAGFVAWLLVTVWAVERLGAGTGENWSGAAVAVAPTVIPIAAAYEIAHSYPFVLTNLARVVELALGVGPLEPLSGIPLSLFWASQVLLIVLGHVVAVVAAHRVSLERYETMALARRGHAPLVVLMVGYTVVSLWIVSRPIVG